MPTFFRNELGTGNVYAVTYDDRDPNLVLSEHWLCRSTERLEPADCVIGSGAVEITLTSLIGLKPGAG